MQRKDKLSLSRKKDPAYWRKHRSGLPPTRTKEIPDFSVTVKQFSLTLQDYYSGHEQIKIIIIFIIDNFKNNLRKPNEKIPWLFNDFEHGFKSSLT